MARSSHRLCVGLLAAGLAWSGSARAAGIEMEEHAVPSDPGIQLYLREKHPAGTQQFGAERILLFVHGATYPAETSFDLPVGGASMMDLLAARGWDVWLVDVRGYSRSTRPASMDRPPAEGKPVPSTAEAARDVAAAVDFIQRRRGVAKINLMGWSWGTSITGLYASTHNEKVERLVLYAPQRAGAEIKTATRFAPHSSHPSAIYDGRNSGHGFRGSRRLGLVDSRHFADG